MVGRQPRASMKGWSASPPERPCPWNGWTGWSRPWSLGTKAVDRSKLLGWSHAVPLDLGVVFSAALVTHPQVVDRSIQKCESPRACQVSVGSNPVRMGGSQRISATPPTGPLRCLEAHGASKAAVELGRDRVERCLIELAQVGTLWVGIGQADRWCTRWCRAGAPPGAVSLRKWAAT
jgi:hypothetical protein